MAALMAVLTASVKASHGSRASGRVALTTLKWRRSTVSDLVYAEPLRAGDDRVGERLMPPLDDRFSARMGTYRVIYRIDEDKRIVTVVDVDHRRDVDRA
jgi:mRNA-degrading endonuclease RelE of RelBE toxin-antitoxin system